jgi:hypothetical protein
MPRSQIVRPRAARIGPCFLAEAPVLIMDKGSLDFESKALIRQAMERLMQGQTSIVIAHRLWMVRSLDRSWCLIAERLLKRAITPRLSRRSEASIEVCSSVRRRSLLTSGGRRVVNIPRAALHTSSSGRGSPMPFGQRSLIRGRSAGGVRVGRTTPADRRGRNHPPAGHPCA